MRHPLADDGVDQPPPRLVAVDQQLARNIAVGESHDAGIAVETRVDDESRCQPRDRAEIAHRRPDVVGVGVDGNVTMEGGHGKIRP
jgi:hypothetical protein